MKTHYSLSALLALSATVVSTQVIAEGLTYDPYENYYSEYYGIGENKTITQAKVATVVPTEAIAEGLTYDPYENYYNQYYGIDKLLDTKKEVKATQTTKPESTTEVEAEADMANPLNYYNW